MTDLPKITDYSKVQTVVITLPAAWALTAPDEDTLKAMLATKDNEARQSRNEVEEKRSRGAATPLPMIEPGQVVILGWRPWRFVRPGGRRALAAHWRGMGPFCQKQTVWASEQGEGRAVEVRYLVTEKHEVEDGQLQQQGD